MRDGAMAGWCDGGQELDGRQDGVMAGRGWTVGRSWIAGRSLNK